MDKKIIFMEHKVVNRKEKTAEEVYYEVSDNLKLTYLISTNMIKKNIKLLNEILLKIEELLIIVREKT
jgi:hypothetical protein